MFRDLQMINERPEPFEYYTARELWTEEHTSAEMLKYHLNGQVDVSSYCSDFIERATEWIADRFRIGAGKHVIDFGCGPGLYTIRLARLGASVTGIDFSPRSIEYARAAAEREDLRIEYLLQDYLRYDSEAQADLILMIMRDLGALSPEQRQCLLRRFARLLKPDGALLLDVDSLTAFANRREDAQYAAQQLDGFWSSAPYYGFLNTFKYEAQKLVLDKYVIVEKERSRTVYNWMQCFSPRMLAQEVEAAGLKIESFLADVAGEEYDSEAEIFASVARKETEERRRPS